MTNHIEELMKAAGVEKQYYSFNSTDGNTYNGELNENGNEKYKKHFIGNPELKERIFTPAKQLDLIKLIGKKHRAITYIQGSDYHAMQVNPASRAFGMYYEAESFEEVIAITTIELLKVNELDKSEVKRILEDD